MNNGDLPANPIEFCFDKNEGTTHEMHTGLSKREAFTMAAMQGLLANSGGAIQANAMYGTGWCNSSAESMAELSVECADAALKELSK